MNAPDFAIDVCGVTKKIGDRTVVNDIAMQVRPGEIYGFLGPNGSAGTVDFKLADVVARFPACDGRNWS